MWRAVVVAMIVACGGPAAPPPPVAPRAPQPAAADILKAMVATYTGANTYADHGVVITTTRSSGDVRTWQVDFETAFVRNGRFRFEYRADTFRQHAVIWSDHVHTYTDQSSEPGIVDDGSDVHLALAAAVPMSSESSDTVPGLLLSTTSVVRDVADGVIEDVQLVDGHLCWRITGNDVAGAKLTLWIDHDSHQLRRLAIARGDVDETLHFIPELDTTIPDALLRSPDVTARPAKPRPPLVIAWLGLRFEDHRLVIREVVANSPAQRAGLAPGDVVVAFDRQSVIEPTDLIELLVHAQIGTAVVLTFEHQGVLSDVTVTLGSHPASIETM